MMLYEGPLSRSPYRHFFYPILKKMKKSKTYGTGSLARPLPPLFCHFPCLSSPLLLLSLFFRLLYYLLSLCRSFVPLSLSFPTHSSGKRKWNRIWSENFATLNIAIKSPGFVRAPFHLRDINGRKTRRKGPQKVEEQRKQHFMDPTRGGLNKHEQAHTTVGIKHKVAKTTSSSSSTTSDDSSDDFFQLDPAALNKPFSVNSEVARAHGGGAATISPNNDFLSCIDDDRALPSSQPVNTQFSPTTSPGRFAPRESPQIQTMERSDVPDPNRIPASIFARSKSNTQMDWSVASNESLFSIHAGNSSFSRDHVFLMDRPGEFSCNTSSPSESQTQLPAFSEPNYAGIGAKKGVEEAPAMEAANAKGASEKERHFAEGIRCSNGSISRRSDCSASSFQSFAFPILTGEGRNSSAKVEVTGAGRSSSEKEIGHEKQQQPPAQTELPKPASSAGHNKWFPCFSCCPSCC